MSRAFFMCHVFDARHSRRVFSTGTRLDAGTGTIRWWISSVKLDKAQMLGTTASVSLSEVQERMRALNFHESTKQGVSAQIPEYLLSIGTHLFVAGSLPDLSLTSKDNEWHSSILRHFMIS